MNAETGYRRLIRLAGESAEPIVPGILYRGQNTVLFGHPGSGKSYLAVLLSGVVASGANWYGRFVSEGVYKCLYIQTDGTMTDIKERIDPVLKEYPEAEQGWDWWHPEEEEQEEFDLFTPDTVKRLRERAEGYDVVFLDALFSSFSGSVNDDDQVKKALKNFRRALRPDQAALIIHHEHKTRRNRDGDVIEEDGQSFAGSWAIQAYAHHMFRYRRKSLSAELVQTKSRGRDQVLDSFHVSSSDDGTLTADSANTAIQRRMRDWLIEEGEITTREAIEWGKHNGVSEKAVFDHLGYYMEDGRVTKPRKGTYQWQQIDQ